MKATMKLATLLTFAVSDVSLAASPIPTFDKEAVTVHPYMRTGEQNASVDMTKVKSGDAKSAVKGELYVRRVVVEGTKAKDEWGKLRAILASYEGREVKNYEFSLLAAKVTEYYRTEGFTVPQAVVPPQEIKDGVLKVHVYTARYDDVRIVKNTSDVATGVLERYLHNLKEGDVIKDRPFELAINNLNDLPAVTARAVLMPGSKPETTRVGIEVLRRPVWNNYIFTDNGGGYYSGRWRYGFNTEINNPGHQGDKITLNGMITSNKVKNYGIRYETPWGGDGTRVGVGWSQSSYELHTNGLYDSLGESKGLSLYGMTPLYRNRLQRVTAIYGFDWRDIKDRLHFNWDIPENVTRKHARVYHVGISGSQYYPNQFTQYSLIYWRGSMKTDGGAYYDGTYHKLTGDLLNIWYAGDWNFRISASGQLANRSLDGSEQFYLGGMNGVRAYGASDGYGDSGYLMSGEIRRATGIPYLEAAAFIDWGGAVDRNSKTWDHLAGWGLGLRYQKDNDWYIQLDWSRKIHGRFDFTEPKNHDSRFWVQIYKMM